MQIAYSAYYSSAINYYKNAKNTDIEVTAQM